MPAAPRLARGPDSGSLKLPSLRVLDCVVTPAAPSFNAKKGIAVGGAASELVVSPGQTFSPAATAIARQNMSESHFRGSCTHRHQSGSRAGNHRFLGGTPGCFGTCRVPFEGNEGIGCR